MVEVKETISGVKGFQAAGVHAGLKANGALDFALIHSSRPCTTAGVFTTNTVKAAPVLFNMERLQHNAAQIRAVVINTVSANACTGAQGMANARQMASMTATQLECESDQILVMSTGVIGTQLPMDKIASGIALSAEALGTGWEAAADAIRTTDTRPKMAQVTVLSPHGQYTIAGISKGSGMIAPNMATTLGVIITDAHLTQAQANSTLKAAMDKSFNKIVVDGDTSTNDMVMLMANGFSGVTLDADFDVQQFQAALTAVAVKLAQDVVRDGEGVTKFITLHVTGSVDDAAADQIAHTIASSPLVKTAFFGKDANWGRMIAAAGRAHVPFDPDQAHLWVSSGEELFEGDKGLLLFANGTTTDYPESAAADIMTEDSIYVSLDCGMGNGEAVVWTCDLSHDYVSINGDYRT